MKSENIIALKATLKANASNEGHTLILKEKQGSIKKDVTTLFATIADRAEVRELIQATLEEIELLYADKRSNGTRQKNRRLLKVAFEDTFTGDTVKIAGKAGVATVIIEAVTVKKKEGKELQAIRLLVKAFPHSFTQVHIDKVIAKLADATAEANKLEATAEARKMQAQKDRLGIEVKAVYGQFVALGVKPTGEQLHNIATDNMYKKQMNG